MAVADPLYIMTRPMTFSSETLVTFMKHLVGTGRKSFGASNAPIPH